MYMSLSNFNPTSQLTEQDLPERSSGRDQELALELAQARQRAQAAESHSALMGTVVEVSEVLLKASSFREVIDGVVAKMGAALGADRCALGIYDPPDEKDAYGYLDFQYEWVTVGTARQSDNPSLRMLAVSPYIDLILPMLAGKPISVLTDELNSSQAQQEQEATGAQSQFQHPIMVDGKLWGTFGLDDCHTRRIWSPSEIDSLRLVASAVASVVKREQLVEARIAAERQSAQDAKRQSELLASVVSASELLLKAQSLSDVATLVLERIGTALHADRGVIGVYLPPDEKDSYGYLDFHHEWVGIGTKRQTDQPELKLFELSNYVEFIKPLLKGNAVPVITEAIQSSVGQQEQEATGAQSQFVYPIMVDGKLWGCFGVDDCRTSRIWSPTEIDSLRLVASAVASVVKREQLVEARIAAERQQTLAAEQHAALLAAVVKSSEFLLKTQSLSKVIDQVMAQMGKALKADRCVVGVCLPPDAGDEVGYIDFQHEWVNFGIERQTNQPELKVFRMSTYPELANSLQEGIATQILTDDIENETSQYEQELTGSKSQFIYPIMVDGKPWGTFAVDDCHTPRIWSPSEIDSLSLITSAIASVVKREKLVEARIAAELAQERAHRASEMAVTNERNRIARDIHDTLAQGFTGVIMQSQAAEDALQKRDAAAVVHHLGRAQRIAQASLHEARRSVFALRPPILENLTLLEALDAELKRLSMDTAVRLSVDSSGQQAAPSNLVATELLRITCEATNNAICHANASAVKVYLDWQPRVLKLSITDDGCGFETSRDHPGFGLISMRERAERMQAALMIESSAAGTRVSITVDPQEGGAFAAYATFDARPVNKKPQ